MARVIRVVLPHHLRTLARAGDEVHVDLNDSATVKSVLDAIAKGTEPFFIMGAIAGG